MNRLIAAAAVSFAALSAAPSGATPQLSCAAQSNRAIQVCDNARCVTVSPRSVCRALASASRRTPRLEETSLTVQERGRRELDALIAGLN